MSNTACCNLNNSIKLRLQDFCPNLKSKCKKQINLLQNNFKWREQDLKILGETFLKVVTKLGNHFLSQKIRLWHLFSVWPLEQNQRPSSWTSNG